MSKLSPMMEQYLSIKNSHKEHIVFFRLGDFYEMFFDDAILVSKELELTLTGRDCGQNEKAPMCGVPHHAAATYIKKLIEKGYKVAICEQTEDPTLAKGIVKREIVRVVTPGTLIEDSLLEDDKNNYICCIYITDTEYGFSCADISTGEIQVTGGTKEHFITQVINELIRFSPSEVIFNNTVFEYNGVIDFINNTLKVTNSLIQNEAMPFEEKIDIIKNQFIPAVSHQIISNNKNAVLLCLAHLIEYIKSTQASGVKRLNDVIFYDINMFMDIDITARRHLELTENQKHKNKNTTLFGVLDKTNTAMGRRFMRKSIEQPLLNIGDISRRHNSVEELFYNDLLRDDLISMLPKIFDIERLLTKVMYNICLPKDIKAFGETLKYLPNIKQALSGCTANLLNTIHQGINPLENLCDLIDRAIVDNPPLSLKDGGYIKKSFSKELDEYLSIKDNVESIIKALEEKEKEKTGIKNLKVSYNRIFGYYIEVTKSYLSQVPLDYIRKQTLANCERYITQELKDLEVKILSANDNVITLEAKIFSKILEEIVKVNEVISTTAANIAYLDFITSLAVVARNNNYVKPSMATTGEINIVDGRHPVIERLLDSVFIPNDIFIDKKENMGLIITGPNMAGKSTYMRQVALIVIMAQMGSFVPCKSAKISVVDKVFTRVGASDDLALGQSTFMVEMNEVAHILQNATPNSLIILDEIGRGTSTFDGMSIAKAVIEYIVTTKSLSCKLMFATHYHELVELENEYKCIKNFSIAVKKNGDDITFLRKIITGPADDSYGIEVAKLAGVPNKIIKRAKNILFALENDKGFVNKNKINNINEKVVAKNQQFEENIMDIAPLTNPVVEKLNQTNVNNLTPLEALNLIYQLKSLL